MAKSAKDYDVSFGYKAQDGYYYGPDGIVGPYHRGNDRPTPVGTPIKIAGKTIGLTGVSGITSGPHLHTQACTAGSNYANDINPTPYEFKPGTVVKAGAHPQFGNYIVIRVGKADLTYAHLSVINVKAGDKIEQGKEEDVQIPSVKEIEAYSKKRAGRKPTPGEIKRFDSRDRFYMADHYAGMNRADLIKESAKVTKAGAKIKALEQQLKDYSK